MTQALVKSALLSVSGLIQPRRIFCAT